MYLFSNSITNVNENRNIHQDYSKQSFCLQNIKKISNKKVLHRDSEQQQSDDSINDETDYRQSGRIRDWELKQGNLSSSNTNLYTKNNETNSSILSSPQSSCSKKQNYKLVLKSLNFYVHNVKTLE